ncbi:MAG: hypothetical protein RLZZ350_1810, partial [Verrucomicrobiota bacterium]
LGLSLQEITPALATSLRLPVAHGFIVTATDTKDEKSGLQPGVVVTGIDGQSPDDFVAFAKILHAKNPGEKVKLGVVVQQRTQQGPFVQTSLANATVEVLVR